MTVCSFWHVHYLLFKTAYWNTKTQYDAITVTDLQKRTKFVFIALGLNDRSLMTTAL